MFGGNNENEAALHWYPEPIANRDLYLVDYVKLYLGLCWGACRNRCKHSTQLLPLLVVGGVVDTVRETVVRVAGLSVNFVSSSPSNGPLNPITTVADPYVQMWGDPSDIRYGDVHFYDYSACRFHLTSFIHTVCGV
jgi:hypothetical protein